MHTKTRIGVLIFLSLAAASSPTASAQPQLLRSIRLGRTASGWSGVTSLKYSADGKWLISIHGLSGRQTVTRWNASTGKVAGNAVFGSLVLIHPDGKTVVYGSGKSIGLWDLTKRRITGNLKHNDFGVIANLSPKGEMLATAGFSKNIAIWNVAKRKKTFTLAGHTERVTAIRFSSDGKMLASISIDRNLKLKSLKLWDTSSGKHLATRDVSFLGSLRGSGPPKVEFDILFSPDGKALALSPTDSKGVTLIQVPSLKAVPSPRVFAFSSAFSPDSQHLVFVNLSPKNLRGSRWRSLTIWKRRDNKTRVVKTFYIMKEPAPLTIEFSQGGKSMITGHIGGEARVWNFDSGNSTAVLTSGKGLGTCLAIHPNGKTLAVGSGDTIKIWDLSRIK